MSSSGATAGLGLMAAASWGGSDFVGGLGARRAPALLVVAAGHIFTSVLLVALCLGMRVPVPGPVYLLYAALGGFEGSLALAIFYRALAMGAMGVTAALTGLLTALVPVVFSLFYDGLPTPSIAAGLVLGCVALWLITRAPASRDSAMKAIPVPAVAITLGALAGVGFGSQLILFKMASGGGVLWTMTAARVAGVLALMLVVLAKPPKGSPRGFWLAGIVAGTLDTAGNLLYIRATQIGRLDVAAVLCSLFPAGTILLAALVLHEKPTRLQLSGMALALAAVMLLSV